MRNTIPDNDRFKELLERFGEHFSVSVPEESLSGLQAPADAGDNKPASGIMLFRAPGRVNLIGEHTDYNNCPVLPVAVDREILAAVLPREDDLIRVADFHPEFGEIAFRLSDYIPAGKGHAGEVLHRGLKPYTEGHWGNYFKAAVNGLLGTERSFTCGFSMLFRSSIPQAAGMSSSSALVVLGSLVLMEVNGYRVAGRAERLELAEQCRQSEWYTGTMGGGMDQAAILFGDKQHTTLIDFNPLQVQMVPFPSGYSIVVTHSTVEAPKTRHAMDLYNRRSVECRIAAAAAGRRLNSEYGITGIEFIGDITPENTGVAEDDLERSLSGLFHEEAHTLQECAELLGIDTDQLLRRYCVRKDGTAFPVPGDGFMLYRRFTHVWEEWKRVILSGELLRAGDMAGFGRLMNEAHASARDLHEISCRELDMLTETAREAGAIGSRLTGAGFGGCAVNIVPDARISEFIAAVRESFYGRILSLDEQQAARYIFPVHPVEGASLFGLIPRQGNHDSDNGMQATGAGG